LPRIVASPDRALDARHDTDLLPAPIRDGREPRETVDDFLVVGYGSRGTGGLTSWGASLRDGSVGR